MPKGIYPRPSILEIFVNNLKMEENGCWDWQGSIHPTTGYAMFHSRWLGYNVLMHRFSYELFRSVIPIGLQIDHLCRNRKCVNPYHLEAVTRKVNILRGLGITAQRARQTSCIHGHLFNTENTYINHKGQRMCKPCLRRRQHEYTLRKRRRNCENTTHPTNASV